MAETFLQAMGVGWRADSPARGKSFQRRRATICVKSTFVCQQLKAPGTARYRALLDAATPAVRDAVPRRFQAKLTRGAMPRSAGFKQKLCADVNVNGFSLHAAARCGADDRHALEQLCRDITLPALANERVQCNAAGQVVLKLKTPWRNGSTHLVMSPLEFMQCLAALIRRQVRPGP
jgi:hypothetical protein